MFSFKRKKSNKSNPEKLAKKLQQYSHKLEKIKNKKGREKLVSKISKVIEQAEEENCKQKILAIQIGDLTIKDLLARHIEFSYLSQENSSNYQAMPSSTSDDVNNEFVDVSEKATKAMVASETDHYQSTRKFNTEVYLEAQVFILGKIDEILAVADAGEAKRCLAQICKKALEFYQSNQSNIYLTIYAPEDKTVVDFRELLKERIFKALSQKECNLEQRNVLNSILVQCGFGPLLSSPAKESSAKSSQYGSFKDSQFKSFLPSVELQFDKKDVAKKQEEILMILDAIIESKDNSTAGMVTQISDIASTFFREANNKEANNIFNLPYQKQGPNQRFGEVIEAKVRQAISSRELSDEQREQLSRAVVVAGRNPILADSLSEKKVFRKK